VPTSQVNVEKKDRVNALQVAAIAFLAAALAAGISGFVTYITTHDQIQAQASQDNSDFLRTQREAAYSKLLTDDEAVAVGLLDYEQDLTTYHAGASLMAVSRDSQNVANAINAALLDVSNIQILGNSQVASDAQALEDQMSSFKTFLDGFPNAINLGLVRDKNFATTDKPIWDDYYAAQRKFITDAQNLIEGV